ncbi:hypothetical protein [Spirosoma sp. 209]|uniref:hypothetical protein n=1 Tax=Spirosoma sp. 209 TaxID=1955701 RepID=UPI00098D3CDD|nr:hypothetical protein [Spirosoma sp. 209]
MNHRLSSTFLILTLFSLSCQTSRPLTQAPASAAITAEGLLNCFSPGTSLEGKPVWCEASAVAYDGNHVLVANDKDMPANLSPVFSKATTTLSDSTQAPAYLMAPAYPTGRKYEDFAQTPDRKFVLLTTAFDRVKEGSPDWNSYNTILYWRTGNEQTPRVLAPDDTSRTSVAYRQKLSRVLATDEFPNGVPYFKIEGLAATSQFLLFGIREAGKAFDSFKPVDKVVAVSYSVNGDRIRLADDWRVVADFDPAKAEPALPQPLSLSSLEYDPARNRFWLLTSLETKNKLDAYLWSISADDLFSNKPFTLVRDAQGQPLHFNHKAEDLTPLDRNQLLIIHDDDRFQLPVGNQTRQPHQAPYSIVTVN